MQLIIVESPTKARTFARFLNKSEFMISSSMGHVRDLPKSKIGIDVEHNFEPHYIVLMNKRKTVQDLIALAKKSQGIILATDPDREGEAIAVHLNTVIAEKLKKKLPVQRIVFHEITKEALLDALKNSRILDLNLFDAQQARRLLDRIVGYKLSPYLWETFSKNWLSAGRVQTVALRLIVERKKERTAFAIRPYFVFKGMALKEGHPIEAKLLSLKGEPYYTSTKITLFDGIYQFQETVINSQVKADDEKKRLVNEQYTVSNLTESQITKTPPPPFTTSLLQQFGSNYFGYSAKRTMQIAQSLYEEGLISYHRTDSFTLSEKFILESRIFIETTYGKEFVSSETRQYKTKSKMAQEAHEAIRPTKVENTLESSVIVGLPRDQQKMYMAIYNRALATQMKEAKAIKQKVDICSRVNDLFVAESEKILFPGYLILEKEVKEAGFMGVWNIKEPVQFTDVVIEEKQTQPPPHYSEASLIKTLEEKGIGRPSTYAPILTLLQERQYVQKEAKNLIASTLGQQVCDLLTTKFKTLFDLDFTAHMEDQLDDIAIGSKNWRNVLREFYEPLEKQLDEAYKNCEKIRLEEKTDELCPLCNSPVVIKMSRFGKFFACSNYPTCKYTKSFLQKTGIPCPKCGKGELVIRFSRMKKKFYACDQYPSCDFTSRWLISQKKNNTEDSKEQIQQKAT